MGRQHICLPPLTAFYLKTQVKLFCGCDALRVCAAWNRRGKKVQWFPERPSWLGRVISLLPESPAPAFQLLPWAGGLGESIQGGSESTFAAG